MNHIKTILILEDNLHILSLLLEGLNELEDKQIFEFSVMILSNYKQVEDFITDNDKADFDVIILDRDCKLNRSFHILDIERFGVDKVVGISTVPEYNEELRKRGVSHIVEKDLRSLDSFVEKVMNATDEITRTSR